MLAVEEKIGSQANPAHGSENDGWVDVLVFGVGVGFVRHGRSGSEPDPVSHVTSKAIGSGYWRVVGNAQDLADAAQRMGQRWLKGIALARALESTAG